MAIGLGLVIAQAKAQPFTHQDSLRGSITPERAWWDLTFYHLYVNINPADSSIHGTNTVVYKVLKPYGVMQIDLQPPMQITKVTQDNKTLTFRRDGNAWFIDVAKQEAGSTGQVEITFGGRPHIATRPPWDGGLTWDHDSNGKPFVGTSCQGDGASLWWPCKDHQYDEPDSMAIDVEGPADLIAVSNGRLRKVDNNRRTKTKTFHWFVTNPINNYDVSVDIGDFVHFGEVYNGEKGPLDCEYYVLREDEAKAHEQFKQVKLTLDAFEHWFGPYPFYKDSYKLVETPFLGMEHQSDVSYGNHFQNGYLGRDLSNSGWGLKFDYIIVHESAHEWFGNSITSKDIADSWIHEGFADYAEDLFVDYYYGKKASQEYVEGIRTEIANEDPIISHYNVNQDGSRDMYFKGANMLHMIRQIINDDEKWRTILRGLSKEFYHQVVTTAQIESYISKQSGIDFSAFFDQYLRDIRVPILEYIVGKNGMQFHWTNCIQAFNMPVRVIINGIPTWIKPTTDWRALTGLPDNATVAVDPNFYVASFNLTAE